MAAEVSIDGNDGEVPLHDADNERLGLVVEYPHPTLGHVRQFGTLVDFSETPTGPYGPAPLVGEHTRQIMERVGYPPEEIDDLLARGHRVRAHRGLPLGAMSRRHGCPSAAARCGGRRGTGRRGPPSVPAAGRAPVR